MKVFDQNRKHMGGVKSKNRHPSWLYCDVVGLSEADTDGVESYFFKFYNIRWKNQRWSLFLKRLADLQTCSFIKKRPQHRYFPVNIEKILILLILKNICKRLLFNFFNGSLLHGPKGLKGLHCMKASGFRVRVTGLVFVFKSVSLALKQVPICIRKPKTNTFGKSIKFLHWLFLVVLDSFRSFQMVLGCFRQFLDRIRSFQVVLDRFRSFQRVRHLSKYHMF